MASSKMANQKPRARKTPPAVKTAAAGRRPEQYLFCLYVAGVTPRSTLAIRNIRKICEEHLAGRYELRVIDIYQQRLLAQSEQIVAAPTLIKRLPLPLRRFIGDMSATERILLGLNLLDKTRDERR